MGIPQERLALELRVDRSLVSRYLRGLRKPPDGFEERVHATLDRFEAAERAAEEARRRVLAGDEPPAAVGAGPKGAA
ncbi:hypothetical protein [Candidatus Palauibacter sp.]|uniref:hypothetical protein n=1 Tax=Candidatus Palauibacter sp. TaxID=3101350 RepID=UPI003CC5806F